MPNKYIVVFKDSVSKDQIKKYVSEVNSNGGQVYHEYESTVNGFAATIPDQMLQSFQSLQGDVIDYIEPDSTVTIQ
ncbi:serine proteinase inhibitor 1 [Moniliophthora roreri MCA 2997]|uniref:Serine proteinase inhibitor 1 n=2 Tax=Moniliophthora roreri TaxID=221103 RepID=V2WXI7_MONRO|nr:serine proteinase inhibitor 1 [Moniliophthora roreri MCA 2997]